MTSAVTRKMGMEAGALAALILVFSCGTGRAEVIELVETRGAVGLHDRIEVLENQTRSLTIDDILSPENAARFERLGWEERRKSKEPVAIWYRFTARREQTGPWAPTWYLRIVRPHLDSVTLYYPRSEGPADEGSAHASHTRLGDPDHPARSMMIPLPFGKSKTRTFHVRIVRSWHAITDMILFTAEGLVTGSVWRDLMWTGFYGVMVLIFIINGLLFAALRDRSYLFCALTQAWIVIFFIFDDSIVYSFWPRLTPDLRWTLMAASIGMLCIWFCLFIRSFLDTRKNAPRFDKVLLAYGILAAGLILFATFGDATWVGRYLMVVGLLVPVVTIPPGVLFWRRGFRAARFYLIAWGAFGVLSGIAVYLMHTHWGGALLKIGSVANGFFLTVAMIDRVWIMQKERQALERAARAAERQMLRADKMAALGQIMAGVAHEINNPNNFIFFNLPIMKRYMEGMQPILDERAATDPNLKILNMPYNAFIEDVYKLLDNMKHGSERITKIVAELKDYVYGSPEERMQPEKLGPVVDRVMALTGKQVKKMVKRFEVAVAEDLPLVEMNAGKIEQLLINLIINAGHAADKEDSWITVAVTSTPDNPDQVEIRVQDNGTGIPPDIREKIFDPFFTTKDRDQGTGLGLAIAKKIIEEHRGTLSLETEVGKGTAFTFRLPAAQSKPARE